jgi:hypothetical protein
MALTSGISVAVNATQTETLDLGSASAPVSIRRAMSLVDGTGAGQADLVFHDRRTLSASGTEDLDLAGSLEDAFGATLTFARVKAIYVGAAAANTNLVQVTRPASNGLALFLAASDGIAVRPGGFFAWGASDATGVAVTAGTGDLLTFTNSAGSTSVTYDIVIIGASA